MKNSGKRLYVGKFGSFKTLTQTTGLSADDPRRFNEWYGTVLCLEEVSFFCIMANFYPNMDSNSVWSILKIFDEENEAINYAVKTEILLHKIFQEKGYEAVNQFIKEIGFKNTDFLPK